MTGSRPPPERVAASWRRHQIWYVLYKRVDVEIDGAAQKATLKLNCATAAPSPVSRPGFFANLARCRREFPVLLAIVPDIVGLYLNPPEAQ